MSRLWMCLASALTVACWTMSVGWTLVSPQHETSTSTGSSTIGETATTKLLGGADRYLTSVSTDKPIYRIGETVYIRGVILNAANHKPLSVGKANALVQIKGSRGDLVASGQAWTENSVWGYSWLIPQGEPGGEYTVQVTYPQDLHAPAERKFDIRAYRAPRLKSQIIFLRDGYGPGEKVSATLDVKRAEGSIPEGAKVTVLARVDGMSIHGSAGTVDSRGLCTVSFALPHKIPRGEGTLSLTVEDGGVVETASKTIPILLQTVDIGIFPEGGDIIGGYKNRIYLQANQPNGKPADLTGKLMWKQGSHTGVVTVFQTEHEGRGRFEFTPDLRREYFLSISKPAGIKTTYPLPKIKSTGALICSEQDIFKKGQPITVKVGCTDRNFRVTLTKREVEVAVRKVTVPTGDVAHPGILYPVSFAVPHDLEGVLTVTVWSANGKPLAERLIFRAPAKPLKITITSDKTSYSPGDTAELTVKATDADGKPVSTVVGLTVTDDSVLEMVEKRERAPDLPVMLFLEPEVKDLADASVYLDPKNPKAPLATDLLLGTQGWRRFALMDLDKFIQTNGDTARRVLAMKTNLQTNIQLKPADSRSNDRLPEGMPRADRPGQLKLPEDIGRVEGPHDLNLFQVEPTVIDERHYTSGRDERHVKYYREFAHQVRPGRRPMEREDFAETLYWNTGVATNDITGQAKFSFGLNDSVTTFRACASAFAADGAVGSANLALSSVQPFYAEVKLPLEVTAGDQVLLPIALVNATGSKLTNVNVDVNLDGDFRLSPLRKLGLDIASGKRVRWIQPINVDGSNSPGKLVLTARAGTYEDKVVRQLSVKPKGFPKETAFGGVLEPGKTVVHTISMPSTIAPGSLSSMTAVYPTPLSHMNAALEKMIQDPNGCFEQTCSTSYPLTMAQQYFLSHTGIDPALIKTSREKLDAGYKLLVGFWCPDRGYEWFGENPGHEALTAFGLMHLTDMGKVRDVDQKMVETTRAWLLKQKDGKGGFTRKRRALHTWIEDKDCSNAYILWALLECGQPVADLKMELASLKTAASVSQNNYVVALAANAFYLAGDEKEATMLMDRLATKQKDDGSVADIKSSIVGSGGESLEIEGTSLATLAWLREPKYAANVAQSIKFLADSCKAGRYGSTQATVLALRAIIAYDKQQSHPKAPGKVRVCVDDQPVGDWVEFGQSSAGTINLPSINQALTPGEHTVKLTMEGGSPMPYTIDARYNALTPASSKDCKMNIVVKMAQPKVLEGASTETNVTVINNSTAVVPSPVAIIGLPGGMEPRHDQLKELVKKGKIDAYEVRGREVVLYWRTLPGNAQVLVPISLIAAIPGTYTGPASRAYLYYTDEHKKWVDGLHVQIVPKSI